MLQRSLLRSAHTSASTSRRAASTISSSRTLFPSHLKSQQPQRLGRFIVPGRQSVFSTSNPRISSPVAGRWYSSEAEGKGEAEAKKEGESSPQKNADSASTESSAEAALKKDVEVKSKEIVDLKDKYLRSVADFANLQERTKREVQAARDFALQKFARDLLESIDNLDRALATVPKEALEASDASKDLVSLHGGLKMTEQILMSTLKRHGLERFDPSEPAKAGEEGKKEGEGTQFNPNIHEAVFQTPMKDKPDGEVFFTQQKGFMLNGRVLRAAKVGVVKNS